MDIEKQIDVLIEKAVSAQKSEDALRFTQAALNAAHVKYSLVHMSDKVKD